MALLRFNVNSGETTLVANTPKTILQIKAPANQRVLIRALRFFGKQAAGGTDVPCKVRMTRSTAAFGTSSAATIGKVNPGDPETIQSTAFATFTAEPTSTDAGLWWELQPQTGVEEFLPDNRPIMIPGGQSVQFEATSSGTPVLNFQAECEE